MKKLALAALLLSPLPAFAEADYHVEWIVGNGLSIDLDKLRSDLNQGREFLTFNGAFFDPNGSVAPATGTCALLTQQRIACRIHALSRDYSIELNSNLSGTISERGPDGSLIGNALLTFVKVQ